MTTIENLEKRIELLERKIDFLMLLTGKMDFWKKIEELAETLQKLKRISS